ncbi:hypothetical protein ABK040_006940 [Willaertia magna]
MAGGKATAAPQKSKKAEQKEKKKLIEDKTFGLKNKNKSKKVQQHIKSVSNTVLQVHDKKVKKELEEKEKKKLEKLELKKREQELKDLFRTVDDKKPEEATASSSVEGQEGEGLEGDELYDQIEQEIRNEEELTIEEIVEIERAKIKSGTPVTFETFMKWKEFKLEQKKKEEERKHKLQMALYERSGQGLTGRDLFKLNEALFVDDEEADETVYEIPEDAIDEDLFLEGDEDNDENVEKDEIEEVEYDPKTWDQKVTPKELLIQYFNKKKIPEPKFERMAKQTPQEVGERVSLSFEQPVKKEFYCNKPYTNKKIAEHTVAWKAYRWLLKYEEQQQQQ